VRECVVFTKNVAELRGQGVTVPDPLPAGRKRSSGKLTEWGSLGG
jgi:hypothetical protein